MNLSSLVAELLKSSTKGKQKILFWAGFTATACYLWFFLSGYGFFLNSITAESPVAIFVFLLAFMLVSMVIAVLNDIGIKYSGLLILITTVMFLGTVSFGIAELQTIISAQLLIILGCFLMGASCAWFWLYAFELLAENGSSWHIAFILTVVLSLSTLGSLAIVWFIPAQAHLFFSVVLVFLIAVGAFLANRYSNNAINVDKLLTPDDCKFEASTARTSRIKDATVNPRALFFKLAAFAIILTILRGVNVGGFWGNRFYAALQSSSILMAIGGLAVYALIAFLVFNYSIKRLDGIGSNMPLLIIIGGLLLLIVLKFVSAESSIYNIVNAVVEQFCYTVFYFTLVTTMRNSPQSAYRIAGLTMGLLYAASMLWTLFFHTINFNVSIMIVLVIYSFVLLIVLSTNNHPVSTELTHEDLTPIKDSVYLELKNKCEELSKSKHLTARETEVLILLVQGRNLPYIRDELTIAQGTVQAHVKSIYKKLYVHSRQDLISLITREDQ